MNMRRHVRTGPPNPTTLVELRKDVVIGAKVADETPPDGLGLVFEADPELTVDSIVKVWFRGEPILAKVKYVTPLADAYRVGVQWCDEKESRPRPFGT